jgi:hypothetical protein
LARRETVDRHGADPVLLFQSFFDFARDRLQMRFGSARANYEVIGKAGDSLQIQDDNVLRLFVRREIGAGFG